MKRNGFFTFMLFVGLCIFGFCCIGAAIAIIEFLCSYFI